MKKLIFIGIITVWAATIHSQNLSFDFTATTKAEVQLGKSWDYSYSDLKTPIKISFKDNKLAMVYESGKVFWNLDVLNIIKIKETIENEKIVEQKIALEYKDKNGFTAYILFEYKYDLGDKYYTLKLPYIYNGLVFSYKYYSTVLL